MTAKLVLVVLCSGCAAADTYSEDGAIESPLTGSVTLTETSVPSAIGDAMDELTGSAPAVRRFTISAPGSTTVDERVRGTVEGLFFRTNKGGNYSLKKFCAKLPTPKTSSKGCATAILAGSAQAGAFGEYLENWSGDFPESVDEVRGYLDTTLGDVDHELSIDVPVGHWEDGEWWLDWTAHRAILFDDSATQVIIVRYFSASSL